MRVRRSLALAPPAGSLAWMAVAIACGGCEKDEAPPATTDLAPSATVAAPMPRDHLVPGELIEGSEVAFGLRLPRGTKVESVFPQQIMAACEAKATDVANYVRPRVSMGRVGVGAASTMFERVQVAANPGRELVIRVEEALDRNRLAHYRPRRDAAADRSELDGRAALEAGGDDPGWARGRSDAFALGVGVRVPLGIGFTGVGAAT